ncbi:MAG: Clavaldehyde dehydrogenase [Candidatus Pacebacteria bacterium GW2011_GWF2_38_9]|nr:MAG: clavaldehyde dehydrogenase [candidate division TM6 bacterium GW2011_GWF2_28_16]KKQ08677.1 MAG: Clavaldehyde dehydrogenase [Candidatus Pacebacteria bacterium GW2011_GWF1_36_5]KKQ88992.1 MAG: Clavaldehyde dehydrogenase [Candidatus Pacebacteria bacterium GW2011_GWF2_38_9]HAZ73168.1 short-chain dehydrogenase [Candidatus Paceibacterota bacterium]
MSKNILITGASSGIGKAVALEFAKKDGSKNHLILVARNQAKLELVAEEARVLGATVSTFIADLGKTADIAKLFTDLGEKVETLDLVFNNAGLGFVKEVHLLSDDEIEQIIDVNVKGMMLVAKKATQMMIKQGYGHIIFTSSLAGYVLLPTWSVYCASKWGITAFANVLRQEVAKHGIKVTTVHPGPVKTEFFDPNKADVDLSKSAKTMPAIPASDVSAAIYKIAYTDKQRIFCPPSLVVAAEAFRFFPNFMQKMFAKMT